MWICCNHGNVFIIVEADETYFQISRKGRRQLTRKPHRRGLSKEKVCVLTVMYRSHNGIEVVFNKYGKRSSESYHIQNVNSYHSRLKSWIIGSFHVVATKYLNHYLWFKILLKMPPTTTLVFLIGNWQSWI